MYRRKEGVVCPRYPDKPNHLCASCATHFDLEPRERMPMKIWIVLHGEQHKGGWVVSVHNTKAKAVKATLAFERQFAGYWLKKDIDGDRLYWENGCDFITVIEKEIET
jgi:hypothetical protein